MLLYWRHAGHTTYCLETFQLLACVNATATSRIAHEVTWCRFVNSRGGAGNNIPVDLYMEHINCTLKDYLHHLGANIGENTIVQTSKSLRGLMNIADQFDRTSGIHASSIYHTCKSSHKDFKAILDELLKTEVFSYIPGPSHRTFAKIKPHISAHVDSDKLLTWMQTQQKKISDSIRLRKIFYS